MDMETYDDLVESIYRAPFKESGWEDVVSKILQLFNSGKADVDQATGNLNSKGGQVRLHEDSCHPWDLWPTRKDHLHDCAINSPTASSDSLSLSGQYPVNETRTHQLSRHLLSAVQLGEQISRARNENALLEHTIDQLRLGVIFVDKQGRLSGMNRYAKRLIQHNDDLFEKASKLQFRQMKHRYQLTNAIKQAATRAQSSTFSLPRQGHTPLSVSVIPTHQKRTSRKPQSLRISIFISDPDDREISDTESLGKRWGLTLLESQFVLMLIQGHKIKQIATELALTENTARWYSKQIMSKLDVQRQADLNTKLMKDIAFLVDTKSPQTIN